MTVRVLVSAGKRDMEAGETTLQKREKGERREKGGERGAETSQETAGEVYEEECATNQCGTVCSIVRKRRDEMMRDIMRERGSGEERMSQECGERERVSVRNENPF